MTVLEQGELRADDDRCAVRFERVYDATPEELWRALTDPEQLRGWLGHASRWTLVPEGEYQLDVGGPTRGSFRSVEEGRLLELTWQYGDEPESLVRFEIVPRDPGCLLVLDHRRLDRSQAAGYGAGWHAHLDALERALAGDRLDWDARYRELRPAYDERAAELGHEWAGSGGTPLHAAVGAGDDERTRALAREHPELRERPDAQGLLPALRALYLRGRGLAEELLPADDRLDVFHAAAFGRVERLRALLEADPDGAAAFSADGFTPLHLACFGGSADTVRLLVESGADVEALARNPVARVRPLGTAAFSRQLECTRALLAAGADPNAAGGSGFRALHTAAQNGDVELAELLLEHGADPQLAADDGRTPAACARAAGHDEFAELLAAGAARAS
jgi:uncharacterized protein